MFDFPGIYKEADGISNNTQKAYLILLRVYLGLIVISAIIFSYFYDIWEVKLVNAIISIIILSLSFVFWLVNFQGRWYNARAVAESIKTVCWRYVTRAEPYNCDDEEAKTILLNTLKHIIDMNNEFKKNMSVRYSSDEQIPDSMNRVRLLFVNERLEYYYTNRVIEQRDWYSSKSKFNNRRSMLFFGLLIIVSLLLSVSLFLDLDRTKTIVFPVEVLLSLLSIIFTWVQTKKYRELDKSYALASYEIGFIAAQKFKIDTEKKLSEYVSNAENAFSREHTQWIARKDN